MGNMDILIFIFGLFVFFRIFSTKSIPLTLTSYTIAVIAYLIFFKWNMKKINRFLLNGIILVTIPGIYLAIKRLPHHMSMAVWSPMEGIVPFLFDILLAIISGLVFGWRAYLIFTKKNMKKATKVFLSAIILFFIICASLLLTKIYTF
ncbi:MAG: hypothetical protein GXO98_02415 [Nitrospirae bacterium]|nr:hypothetical protein [Nitrospirota bacterium]